MTTKNTLHIYAVTFDSGYMAYVRAPDRKTAMAIGHSIVPYDARCQWRYKTKTRAQRVGSGDIPSDAIIHSLKN